LIVSYEPCYDLATFFWILWIYCHILIAIFWFFPNFPLLKMFCYLYLSLLFMIYFFCLSLLHFLSLPISSNLFLFFVICRCFDWNICCWFSMIYKFKRCVRECVASIIVTRIILAKRWGIST
jgi:hypothetical protein